MWDLSWSTARYVLKLTDAEFYTLTPRQYSLLLRRHEESVKQQEVQTGILASTFANYIVNWSMSPPKKGLHLRPADFMPSELVARQGQRKKRISKQAVAKQFTQSARLWMEAMKAHPKTVINSENPHGHQLQDKEIRTPEVRA